MKEDVLGINQTSILLVDQDEEWLRKSGEYLVQKLYQVDFANDGKTAQLNIYNNRYFVVIINFDVQNHSSIQVLKYIKLNYGSTKVIITLSNNSTLSSKGIAIDDLIRLGATDVFIRPDSPEELEAKIVGFQSYSSNLIVKSNKEGNSDEVELDQDDDKFTHIKIEDFFSGNAVLFDVYVKIKEKKYIKILHAGDAFDQSRINKYKERGVKYLNFANEDRIKYIKFSNFLNEKIIKNKAVSTETKIKLTKNVVEKFCEEIYLQDIKPTVLSQSTEIVQNIYNFIEKEKDLYKYLRSYAEMDPTAYTHSYLVSLFSCLITKQFAWDSAITRETISLAAMMHDIGKSKLSPELAALKPEKMNDQQFKEYQSHVKLGAEIVNSNKSINPTVAQIIMQHHELCDGTGFPNGIKKQRMSTLARIVSFCNQFANHITENSISPAEGLKSFLSYPRSIQICDGEVVESFCHVFINPADLKK